MKSCTPKCYFNKSVFFDPYRPTESIYCSSQRFQRMQLGLCHLQ